MDECDDVILTVDDFGKIEGSEVVKRFTWKIVKTGMTLQVITYGATITSIKVPDKRGDLVDVVMGFDTIEEYQNPSNPYFGSIVGRVANRTKDGTFTLNGVTYQLTKNLGNTHLHGGFKGFDKVNWQSDINKNSVTFSYISPDGEEGYPGNVFTKVTYKVNSDNTIKIIMSSTSNKPTPINLTNHSYFNLAGHNAGPGELYEHVISIYANEYTVLDENYVTTGEIRKTSDLNAIMPQSLSTPTRLKQFMPSDGFDTNFCIDMKDPNLNILARVFHPSSGRILEMYGNQPGIQFYTANYLPNPDKKEEPMIGKSKAKYSRHGAFCLEPQNYPNAINHAHFPNSVLNPGEEYVHEINYKFKIDS